MKIAVDARELVGRPTGVGRYLAELLNEWAGSKDARRHEWQLYAHQEVPLSFQLRSAVVVVPGGGGSRWEQGAFSRALRRNKPDVLFAPGYTAPLTTPAPIALTVHDVSFAAHPEWFSRREGMRRRVLTSWSARRAHIVLTDSLFSRDEIVKHIGIPENRIRVVPLGLRARPPEPGSMPREPLILFVGSIFQRRHVDALIDVFINHVARRVPGSRLEIVGENRLHPPGDPGAVLRQCAPDLARRVTLRSYVDEATLNMLYDRASVFAFLSEYEGFGLTPLEALAAGVAPVVLDTQVAREVYGPAARYVSTITSPEPLAEALVDLLTHSEARRAVLQHAPQVLGRYRWSDTAAATLQALKEAAGA